jgi:hypothetical protein
MLLEHAADRDFQPVAGGLLDAETVWDILLVERLGLSGAHPDMVELLRGTAESDLAARWQACAQQFREAASAWIVGTAGDAGRSILRCIEGEHGAKALGVGLAMGVVYHETVGKELDKAAGRLEAYVGTTNIPTELAKRWSDAAAIAARQLTKPALRRCMGDAEIILQNVGATGHGWRSDDLESGFEQRLSRFGLALARHVDARATAVSEELHGMYTSVKRHRQADDSGRRMERCEMAIRLARWLAEQNAVLQANSTAVSAFAHRYAVEGGFVDWARQVLRGGEPNKELATAFVRLVDRVTELREAENKRFASALAEQSAAGDVAAGLIPVEQVLDEVVAKAALSAPVLLLLLDGMSWAVFRELIGDIIGPHWNELAFGASPRRLIGLAALPSITEVCRTSLLCGTLKRGQAFDEMHGFASYDGLTALSQPHLPPKLFHKAALEGDEDSSLAGDIRQALADKRQRVVGIVINAVDDHLDKGDQIDAVWTRQSIRVLEPILAEAGAAGRLVILLSDHGHTVDRQTEGREATDGLRWRRPGQGVADGELEISSGRVVLPDGGRVIVPWSERLRYGPKKNGYHGGATPQEMLIPIGILWPELQPPDGLAELPPDLPAWWTEPTLTHPAGIVVEQPLRQGRDHRAPPTLFDQPKPALVPPAPLPEPWIDALLRSDVFAVQKKLASRARIDEVVLQRVLIAMNSRGGSMTMPALAGAIGVPEHRLPGLVAVMQRLLNVEGYAILDRQDAANTVVLNIPLLKKQFELPL